MKKEEKKLVDRRVIPSVFLLNNKGLCDAA